MAAMENSIDLMHAEGGARLACQTAAQRDPGGERVAEPSTLITAGFHSRAPTRDLSMNSAPSPQSRVKMMSIMMGNDGEEWLLGKYNA